MTKLQKIKAEKHISCRELAKRLDMEASSVYAIERCGLHGVRAASRYAAALGCRTEDILEIQ